MMRPASLRPTAATIMPHIEDAVLPWQWAYYPEDRKADEVAPWIEAFVNARKWIEDKMALQLNTGI